nr:uncharacterized protein LOC113809582 [Penaeus vannamei]
MKTCVRRARPPTPRSSPPTATATALWIWLLCAALAVGAWADNAATHGRSEDWTEEAEPTEPADPCPMCDITQLPEDSVSARDPPVKVVCHDQLLITSFQDIWPHCLPPTTKQL